MLRYVRHGLRNFVENQDFMTRRLNWEFFAVLDGCCAPHFVDEPLPTLQESTFWVFPPMVEFHWISEDAPCRRALFHFSWVPDVLVRFMANRKVWHRSLSEEEKVLVWKLAEDIEPYHYHPDEAYDLRLSRLTAELTLLVLAGETNRQVKEPFKHTDSLRVQKAERYFLQHLKERPSLDEVALAVGVSQSQLRRHFYHVRKESPQYVFNELRLREACRYLSETSLTVESVANETGFRSTVDLHRCFKQKYGTTPHRWRCSINTLPGKSIF